MFISSSMWSLHVHGGFTEFKHSHLDELQTACVDVRDIHVKLNIHEFSTVAVLQETS